MEVEDEEKTWAPPFIEVSLYSVGPTVGVYEGDTEGNGVGECVGDGVGFSVGKRVGFGVGEIEGDPVDGGEVGLVVGESVWIFEVMTTLEKVPFPRLYSV